MPIGKLGRAAASRTWGGELVALLEKQNCNHFCDTTSAYSLRRIGSILAGRVAVAQWWIYTRKRFLITFQEAQEAFRWELEYSLLCQGDLDWIPQHIPCHGHS